MRPQSALSCDRWRGTPSWREKTGGIAADICRLTAEVLAQPVDPVILRDLGLDSEAARGPSSCPALSALSTPSEESAFKCFQFGRAKVPLCLGLSCEAAKNLFERILSDLGPN